MFETSLSPTPPISTPPISHTLEPLKAPNPHTPSAQLTPVNPTSQLHNLCSPFSSTRSSNFPACIISPSVPHLSAPVTSQNCIIHTFLNCLPALALRFLAWFFFSHLVFSSSHSVFSSPWLLSLSFFQLLRYSKLKKLSIDSVFLPPSSVGTASAPAS